MIWVGPKEDGTNTIISIAGRLQAGHLAELEAHCTHTRQAVVLDLSELLSRSRTAGLYGIVTDRGRGGWETAPGRGVGA